MTTPKITQLLSTLLQRSKDVGEKKNASITAQRYAAVLMECMISDEFSNDPEWRALYDVLRSAVKDPKGALDTLLFYCNNVSDTSYSDMIYMRQKLYEAFENAQKVGRAAATALDLWSCICMAPPQTIQDVLKGNYKANVGEYTRTEKKSDMEWKFDRLADKIDEKEAPASEQSTKPEVAKLVAHVKDVRTYLSDTVLGQDNAINVFTTGYFQGRMLEMNDKSRRRPSCVFLFAGPPGVGKTFLAETVARKLELPYKCFDMSEYASYDSVSIFAGSKPEYQGSKKGNVTGFVEENPRCVLLFDEIEKAHINIIHLFLQMLDGGRLKDNYTNKTVSFKDAIIIMTTNAGKQLYEESESGDLSCVSRKVVLKALQNDVDPRTGTPFFPAAICSRFASGSVVMFNHITANILYEIAKKEITRHANNFKAETGISVSFDDSVYTALLFSEGGAADARTIRGRAERFFNDELYELLRMVSSDKAKSDIEALEGVHVGIDLTGCPNEITDLFTTGARPKVLMLANEDTVSRCHALAPSFSIQTAATLEAAVDIIKKSPVDFVMLDMLFGIKEDKQSVLNIEDVPSLGRDFFRFLRDNGSPVPVYLLESDEKMAINEEEIVSLSRQGMRGVLKLSESDSTLSGTLYEIATSLHQQASMRKLARDNKLVTFETLQSVEENGKRAKINLFDFALSVAVEASDANSIVSAASRPNVRFEDVIGAQDAKKELTFFVDYLKNPNQYMGTGLKAPRGILLYGPPGTGKTLLAKAMACEAGVTFLSAEGNQFLKKYVGEGPETVHELFRTARKYAPAILFVDEIDAIAKERRGGTDGGTNAMEQTLTAFLTEMDGFSNKSSSRPVFVLAATNFDVKPGGAKSLDEALMRRFDRTVYVDLPTKEDRIRFLRMKFQKNPAFCISDTELESIAMRSTGMSLAKLENALELALRSAMRQQSTKVTDDILEEAFETYNGGEEKKWDASTLQRVAIHEAGHALLYCLAGQTPSYLTIVARGDHGGYMQHGDTENKQIYTKEELLSLIRTSLGGRAAEIVCFGKKDGISTGASGDLASASRTARAILCTYGMDEEFGMYVPDGSGMGDAFSDRLHAAVNRILTEEMANAIRLIEENREAFDRLVNALLLKNRLNQSEIEALVLGKESE